MREDAMRWCMAALVIGCLAATQASAAKECESTHIRRSLDGRSIDLALITKCKPDAEAAPVAVPRPSTVGRHATKPRSEGSPERDRSLRGQRVDEPRRADTGQRPPTREENQSLDPMKGESWFYMGGKRCKTYQPMGETPRIICP
jgi:hypothetical protein